MQTLNLFLNAIFIRRSALNVYEVQPLDNVI